MWSVVAYLPQRRLVGGPRTVTPKGRQAEFTPVAFCQDYLMVKVVLISKPCCIATIVFQCLWAGRWTVRLVPCVDITVLSPES